MIHENVNFREVKRLSAEVRSQLRSGVVITNMAQCVVELVLNALDAGATSIAVRVNFNYFKVQVVDNGCGMKLEELDLIGERFMTSKCHSISDLCNNLKSFGFRGEALASIREISGLLILESRPQEDDVTYSKAFNHGKAHKANISATKRATHGTTVTVHDFMYNMPVRRQRLQSAIDLEEIKSSMESIALIQPQASFSLRNDTNGNLVLHTWKCSDTLTAFTHLFGQDIASTLVCVGSTLSEFKINGYISREGHYHKNLQFIYINKRLVLKTKLHKLANSMLANSVLLKNNAGNDLPISKEGTVGRWLAFSPPRREKHAIFILNIECPFMLTIFVWILKRR
ncbi:hypothetical protein L9F63_001380 [Diploptera punctata]|uniref:DNA mismatch repair protein S5 domain-containing protein n=1 Tax=Diploptera punctata TaxID=6984 RepID=A0AAD8A461_DIPPU|nr:hypothetical protein L9F63_001380 [Diploptera punctata]